ncbi:hypothetical protein CASFOL_004939 [Castilleja foliolosa]|uniref:Uncharacterized protein n=1 Tax=Castilleja foliolosa TaxID=1961234 RepID=A0ABD3EDX0_9LAMI
MNKEHVRVKRGVVETMARKGFMVIKEKRLENPIYPLKGYY